MSLTSLAYHLENANSNFLDPKNLKRHEPSFQESFINYLSNSPYLSSPKTLLSSKDRSPHRAAFFSSSRPDGTPEAQHPKLRALGSLESSVISIVHASQNDHGIMSQHLDVPMERASRSNSGFRKIVTNLIEPSSSTSKGSSSPVKTPKKMVNRFSGVFNQGFESPKAPHLDQATRSLIKGLQSRVIRLEKEVVKLKKENMKLVEDNKKCQELVSLTAIEQEKAAKMKDQYERQISKLRENCTNNKQIMDSLKEILTLQEEEFFDLVVKEKKSIQSLVEVKRPLPSSLGAFPSKTTRSTTSIERGPDSLKELGRRAIKQKPILKITTRIGSKKDGGGSEELRRKSTTLQKVTIVG